MSDTQEPKLEWIFDGSRDEFWAFVIFTALAMSRLVFEVRMLFWGYHASIHASWTDWLIILLLPIYVVCFYRIEKLLGIAAALLWLHTGLRLATVYGIVNLEILSRLEVVLSPLSSVFIFLGCGLYLKRRLRKEPVIAQSGSIPEA
jgi:hypothetical protein